MPTYKLTYFDAKGRAEPIRLLLSYLGQPFEDVRVSRDQWATMKKDIKFGKLPILEVDGKRLYQSEAICRYLAKKANLAGNSDDESLQIDAIIGTIDDMVLSFIPALRMSDPKAKEEALAVHKKETIPYYLAIYDDIVKSSGYLANGKLSWADLFFVGFFSTFESMLNEKFTDSYSNLKAHKEKVQSIPGIKEWVAKSEQ